MSTSRKGIRVRLSPARRLVNEFLHHARKVPSIPVRSQFNISRLAAARATREDRPTWVSIFLKAFALVANEQPELRRCFQSWPTAHLYEHPLSVCTVLVERDWEGEKAVFAAKLHSPETTSLVDIQKRLRKMQTCSLNEMSDFRQLMNLCRMPTWLRRVAFWLTLNLSGERRCRRFGTFMVSTLGDHGAELLHPKAAFTSYLSFGPVQPNGDVAAVLTFDHRVLDGRTAARALAALRDVLNGEVCAEIQSLPCRQIA